MPQIAQRLREPAAFALLAYAALSTLFHTIDFLFAPGNSCSGPYCGAPGFSDRAPAAVDGLLSPILVLVLVATVVLAHVQNHLKAAKVISLTALITAGVAALFGLIALFASFGANVESGWGKTETFFIGLAQLALLGLAGWFILGYWQQHAPARPAGFPGQPQQGFPQQQWQPQGQWQQGAPQQGQPGASGQWQPQGQAQPAPGAPAPQQGQPWGPPPQGGAPQQQGFGGAPAGGSDSMMTQAIPTVPQNPPAPPAPPATQQAPETQQFPPVGNWTAE